MNDYVFVVCSKCCAAKHVGEGKVEGVLHNATERKDIQKAVDQARACQASFGPYFPNRGRPPNFFNINTKLFYAGVHQDFSDVFLSRI